MITLLKMAYRDLGRNRRRTFFSALALAMGMALLLYMAGMIAWDVKDSTETTIRLQSGHLQVRAATYNQDKTSLAYQDLVENPAAVAAQIASLAPVQVATPRLYASGIVASGDTTMGVSVVGIDPPSPANAPFRDGLIDGAFLASEDTSGLLVGKSLAEKMGLKAGDSTILMVNTSNGSVDQQSFTVRGVYTTHTPGYDEAVVFLPLAKAQAITQAGSRASTIFILLKDRSQTPAVASALKGDAFQIKTFEDLNPLLVSLNDYASTLMIVMYLIILAITVTVIVNTLIMSVYERTREIGILSAIGMRSGRIMTMFFIESALLAFLGIGLGLALGIPLVSWLGDVGIPIGNIGMTGMLIGERMHAIVTLNDVISLSITALVVTLLGAIYPARLAAKMEPVEALHSAQ